MYLYITICIFRTRERVPEKLFMHRNTEAFLNFGIPKTFVFGNSVIVEEFVIEWKSGTLP